MERKEDEYKNKTDISTCLIISVIYLFMFFGSVSNNVLRLKFLISSSVCNPYLIRLLSISNIRIVEYLN